MGEVTGARSVTGRLLAIARSREAADRRRNPFPPLVIVLANVFVCAFSQAYLADDPGGVYLPLFIVVQCLLAVLVTLSFAGRTGAEIIRKTRLLPGARSAGFGFLLLGSLRRPELLGFCAVGCAFPAMVHANDLAAGAGIVLAAALPVATAQALCCGFSAVLIRSDRPVTGLVLLAVVASAAATASVFVFGTGALASSVPLAGWSAEAIRSFASGDRIAGVTDLVLLALAAAVSLAVFRR